MGGKYSSGRQAPRRPRPADAGIRHTAQAGPGVPQCGYCQSSMLMAAAALLRQNPEPSDAEIDAAITNICRRGTDPRVRAAIRRLVEDTRALGERTPEQWQQDAFAQVDALLRKLSLRV